MDFADITVVVTGANKGIGEAIARHFFDKGANVVFAVRRVKNIILPKSIIDSPRCSVVQCDVTRELDIERMIRQTVHDFGSLDVLVNNAGVDQPCSLINISMQHLDYIWDTNVRGLILTSKHAARIMINQQRGKIINMSSIAGKEGSLYHTAYVSSKHAVIGATKCMARELAPYNITVNAVCPGLIDTDMLRSYFKEFADMTHTSPDKELSKMIEHTPRGKIGSPQDVAELVGFLCSEYAENITGQSINTDGGFLQH